LTLALSLAACGEDDDGVTFADDVRPLFAQRCTVCHRPGSPINVDIQNPFAGGDGLVNAPNSWAADNAYPGETPLWNVVVGEPDQSFLLQKLGDSAAGALPANGHGGAPMPLEIEPLTEDEIQTLVDWVANGALNDDFFTSNVRPIFGAETGSLGDVGSCIHCHYAGTPNPPNLTDPFGPEGLINIRATYRAGINRVTPFDPEGSFMIQKVRATVADSVIGAPMPIKFEPLSTDQVAIVRQWIVEGARP
jgi:hypothetical protein